MEEDKSEFSTVDIAVKNSIEEGEFSVMEELATEDSPDHFIKIIISDPQKIGDGMSSYLAYSITTNTNIPKFKSGNFSTLRRFSDFLGLHSLLVAKYLRLGKIIPPVPSKNIIGSTKVKISPQQTDSTAGPTNTMEWVEIRRAALERFLQKTAQHPILRVDLDFINFLQSDKELPRAVNTAALSGAGVMRLFNKFGETVNRITYKMDENDPWFDDKIIEIESLDLGIQNLHSTLKTLVNNRKELSALTGSVSKAAALLSTCEEHTALSRALSNLADIEEKLEILRSEQAYSDFFILSEYMKDYIGLFEAIKAVVHERVKVFQNWQHAQMQLTRRRENKSKNETSGKNERSDIMQKEIEEWEYKVQRCQQEFDDISSEIKQELNRFTLMRHSDFKIIIKKYIENQMANQQQLIKYWEAFIPTTKEIF